MHGQKNIKLLPHQLGLHLCQLHTLHLLIHQISVFWKKKKKNYVRCQFLGTAASNGPLIYLRMKDSRYVHSETLKEKIR